MQLPPGFLHRGQSPRKEHASLPLTLATACSPPCPDPSEPHIPTLSPPPGSWPLEPSDPAQPFGQRSSHSIPGSRPSKARSSQNGEGLAAAGSTRSQSATSPTKRRPQRYKHEAAPRRPRSTFMYPGPTSRPMRGTVSQPCPSLSQSRSPCRGPGQDAEVSRRGGRALRTSGRLLPPGGPHPFGSAQEALPTIYHLIRSQLRANGERPFLCGSPLTAPSHLPLRPGSQWQHCVLPALLRVPNRREPRAAARL